MAHKILKILINKKLILIAGVIFALNFSTNSQVQNRSIKKFPNGTEINLEVLKIVEYRFRPQEENINVPKEKLFDRQKWDLKSYILTIKKPESEREEFLWEFNVSSNSENKFKLTDGFSVSDVYLSDNIIHILYEAYGTIYVADIYKNSEKWEFKTATELVRNYETRPIVAAKFVENRAEIYLEYLDIKSKRGFWTWKIKDDKWKLISNKLIKEKKEN